MTLRRIVYTVACSSLLGTFGCNSTEIPPHWIAEPEPPQEVVEGEAPGSAAWQFVDATLQEQGDLGSYGDLRGGLSELEQIFKVTITDSGDYWSVSLWPHSGTGHDFVFGVVKDTGEIVDVFVGSLFPPPPAPE